MIVSILAGVIAGLVSQSWGAVFLLPIAAAILRLPETIKATAALRRAKSYDPRLVEQLANLGAIETRNIESVNTTPVWAPAVFMPVQAYVRALIAASVTFWLF